MFEGTTIVELPKVKIMNYAQLEIIVSMATLANGISALLLLLFGHKLCERKIESTCPREKD